jgi:hypothetical protein
MQKIKKFALVALGTAATLLPTLAAKAQTIGVNETGIGPEFGTTSGLGTAPLQSTIAGLIRVVMGFLGIVAVVVILLGGFMWMTAGGNEEKVGKAKKLIISGIIGLVIVISAYAIATFVVGSIINAQQV